MDGKTTVYWQTEDRKTLKKINNLQTIYAEMGRKGLESLNQLIGNLTGYWSRRINDKERLIYKIDDENVYIVACRYHYSDT